MSAEGSGDARNGTQGLAVPMAIGAAALFGLSTPAAKALLEAADPWVLAGLLYLGAGAGLGLVHLGRLVGRGRVRSEAPVSRSDWPWLLAAIAAGGVAGPVLLMIGLASASASAVALLLNLEGVFTAALAWLAFGEHVGRRVALGMVAITAGAVALAFAGAGSARIGASALAVVGACLAWGLDNNLTRKVSASDPVQIAALKGLVAGAANLAIALSLGRRLPGLGAVAGAAAVGLLGYGVSLVLFVRALRDLGAARTGAYFSTAPFLGALGAVAILGEPITARLLAAAALMAVGVWLHLTERHRHGHAHAVIEHDHAHHHDAHHRHARAPGAPGSEPHAHWHWHSVVEHEHPHYPDTHHRHEH